MEGTIYTINILVLIFKVASPRSNCTVQTAIFMIALVKLYSHVQETVFTHPGWEQFEEY